MQHNNRIIIYYFPSARKALLDLYEIFLALTQSFPNEKFKHKSRSESSNVSRLLVKTKSKRFYLLVEQGTSKITLSRLVSA